MSLLVQGGKKRGCGGWKGAVALVGLCCTGLGWAGARGARAGLQGARAEPVKVSAWDAAVAARAEFEAEPEKTHTRQEYAEVMDGFRAIYHADPGDTHAARAVAQVAELLAEQGREMGDRKSLRAAAGQYEFLAKAYPGGSMAGEALVQALGLLGPAGVNDGAEARKVRAELELVYPKYARVVEAREAAAASAGGTSEASGVVVAATPTSQRRDMGHPADTPVTARRDMGHADVVAATQGVPAPAAEGVAKETGAPAMVTGIRHWSTSSYTRVAIDLNVDPKDEVKYEAARVENPDRIFFDLHHARLASQLTGKSFTVTDDGFLTRIRAAQFSDDVTRVVLDVHQVAEYSAFLLPNPTRLIIDIHGKDAAAGDVTAERAQRVQPVDREGAKGNGAEPGSAEARERAAVPDVAVSADVVGKKTGGTQVSSLPPMPVTDGSAGFGLPDRGLEARGTGTVGAGARGTGTRGSGRLETEAVARPRVVMSSKPTVAKPVPNTVTKSATETGTEVAAVSLQPGKVEATRRPTSGPIAEKSRDVSGSGERERLKPMHAGTGSRGLAAGSGVESAGPAEAAPPMADGETSLVRALGLKIGRIVIDAGHGGHDSGTLGAGGIEEKDVVLDVALRLGKLLHDRLGAEIVYTRADDTFIPLETRTAIANKAQADLFISVHANSSVDTDARGVEVYYLNFTSDPEAMTVASRENAVSTESVHELSDLVKKIALKDKIEESKELASDVDASLYAGLKRGNEGLKDRGVKKAPFVVLIGANMPSILAEISFVTNPVDGAKLETPEYRERVAESLYKGVARYAGAINGRGPTETKARATERAAAR